MDVSWKIGSLCGVGGGYSELSEFQFTTNVFMDYQACVREISLPLESSHSGRP